MVWVVLAVVFFTIVAGVCLFAGYHIGYGDGAEDGFFEGYDAAMADNRREHYLTD